MLSYVSFQKHISHPLYPYPLVGSNRKSLLNPRRSLPWKQSFDVPLLGLNNNEKNFETKKSKTNNKRLWKSLHAFNENIGTNCIKVDVEKRNVFDVCFLFWKEKRHKSTKTLQQSLDCSKQHLVLLHQILRLLPKKRSRNFDRKKENFLPGFGKAAFVFDMHPPILSFLNKKCACMRINTYEWPKCILNEKWKTEKYFR